MVQSWKYLPDDWRTARRVRRLRNLQVRTQAIYEASCEAFDCGQVVDHCETSVYAAVFDYFLCPHLADAGDERKLVFGGAVDVDAVLESVVRDLACFQRCSLPDALSRLDGRQAQQNGCKYRENCSLRG